MKTNAFLYDYAVLLGVDGAGAFFRDAKTPNLDRIFANGAVSYHVHTAEPTISAECWGSMLLGVTPEVHRLTNTIVSSRPYDTHSLFPSIFRVIRENDPTARLASFCNWNPINYGIIEDDLGVHKETGLDSEITDKAVAYLKDGAPKFLFMQFDEVDAAGHGNGYGTPGHIAQIETTDGYIAKIYAAYERLGILENTLFIVTADHGGTPGGSHGGVSDAEKYVMYAAVGKTIAQGEIGEMEIRDNAAILAHAFGYAQPDSWTARIPDGVFKGISAGERPVYEISYLYPHRMHTAQPTPTNIPPISDARVYLSFDGTIDDARGNRTEKHGKLYFVDGYFGSGIRLDDGYVTLPDIHLGTQSFSAAFWLKAGMVAGDPVIFGNKDWHSGVNPGFVLAISGSSLQFNLGNGVHRMDLAAPLPIDFRDGWVHVTLVVDREKSEIRLAYDCGVPYTAKIPEALRTLSFDTAYPIHIGQDGTGSYPHPLSCVLDDLILADGKLEGAELDTLAKHYGIR